MCDTRTVPLQGTDIARKRAECTFWGTRTFRGEPANHLVIQAASAKVHRVMEHARGQPPDAPAPAVIASQPTDSPSSIGVERTWSFRSSKPDPLRVRYVAGWHCLVKMCAWRSSRRGAVDIFSVPMSDEEEAQNDLPPKRAKPSAQSAGTQPSGPSRGVVTPMQLTESQRNHLLLAKGMVAVHLSSILRRLQRRLSAALQAPTLRSTGRVKLSLDGFAAVPGLWSGVQRADGDRQKRAREDRAGLRGRSAVQRARAGGAPGEGRGRKRRPEGDQGADLFGRTAAPRARQESVHLHFGRAESCTPSGSGVAGAGVKPAGLGVRSRGAALQACAARSASG